MRALVIVLLAAGVVSCGGGKKGPVNPLASCGTGLCGDGPLYATSTLQLVTGNTQRQSPGYHLTGADTGSCPESKYTDPTTGKPVDNQLANLIPIIYNAIGDALPTLIQNAVNDGGISLIWEIVGDPTRDGIVDVVVHHGNSTPLLGADALFLANQTIELSPEAPLGICQGATVSDGQVNCGPFQLTVPIVVFGVPYQLTFLGTLMKMTLDPDGTDATLLLGGAVAVTDIQALAVKAGPAAGNILPVVDNDLPSLADVADPVTGQCARISGVLGMTARSTFATMK